MRPTRIRDYEMKKIFLMGILSACVLGFVSCSNDDDEYRIIDTRGGYASSGRDKIYLGDKLSVYIGDELIKGVKADVRSILMDLGDTRTERNEDGSTAMYIDPVFFMSIVFTGFPTASDKTTIYTNLLHFSDISGIIEVKNQIYKYTGEFTGDPLHNKDSFGLIIHFTEDKLYIDE